MDYRTPNIYDPSTLTEPYAYARANPVMFWDPDGLSWLGDFAKHSFEYFASGQAAENLTAFVDGAVDGTVGAVLHAVTETGNMVHDLGNASYSIQKYALTGELHEFEMRSAIGKSAEQGNDGVAGAARNLGAMAKGAVTAPLEMGKDLTSGDPRRMGQGLAKLEIALAMAGARHGFSSPVSQVGRGVVQDIKSTATTILEKSKSLVSKKSAQPPSSITPSPTLTPNSLASEISDGSFSITELGFSGYPKAVPRPQGPFRLLEGAEYDAARKLANTANQAIRKADPASLVGNEIHEIHPVKFGGSPTDPANKIALPRDIHRREVTPWWNSFLRSLQNNKDGD